MKAVLLNLSIPVIGTQVINAPVICYVNSDYTNEQVLNNDPQLMDEIWYQICNSDSPLADSILCQKDDKFFLFLSESENSKKTYGIYAVKFISDEEVTTIDEALAPLIIDHMIE